MLRGRDTVLEMVSLDQVDQIARGLAGATLGLSYGHRTWMVGERGFAWQRSFSKADLARFGDETPPQGEILAVATENLDAKDALLAIAPPGFFTIPHFNGFPAVLIELRKARIKDVRAAVVSGFQAMAAKPPRKPRKPKARPAARKGAKRR